MPAGARAAWNLEPPAATSSPAPPALAAAALWDPRRPLVLEPHVHEKRACMAPGTPEPEEDEGFFSVSTAPHTMHAYVNAP